MTLGLTATEALELLALHGSNQLPEAPPERWWSRLVRQLRSPIIYILLFALAFDVVLWAIEGADGWPIESIAILVILGFNAGMGVWQEYRAEDALARLREMAAPQVVAYRDGIPTIINASQLVPGDLVRIESGARIPADGTITDGRGLSIDESVLTGESLPVERGIGGDTFSGTLIVRGSGRMVVTRTGSDSAMGRIAGMLLSVTAEPTPLERRLAHFGHRVARWVGALAVVLMVAGIGVEGVDRVDEVLLFAVAVAVAAVPEGLPAVLTLTLALGTERMAIRKAVVRRLSAVEALGSVTVIATDKTGTLTENRMIVRGVDSPDPDRALRAMVLASDAELDGGTGDPLEVGLCEHALASGLDPASTRDSAPRVSERPFDSEWKYMRVTVRETDTLVSYLKGAPEVLLAASHLSDDERDDWHRRIETQAADGNRILGLAWAKGETDTGLTWLGTVAMWDPPRPEVAGAVKDTLAAGVRVLMVTGDHPATALAVARTIGIKSTGVMTGNDLDAMPRGELAERIATVNVFARVKPEHKLALVEALKANGNVVGMTGDGVNDAPALKRSDVGIAMGTRGSEVSREVADLVLLDDNFATITAAVEEGRSIYANILKFIRFLFSTNVALVLLVAIGVTGAAIAGIRDEAGDLLVPLVAVQLLWINILADGPPALALGLDRNPGVLGLAPRRASAPLLGRRDVSFVLGTGAIKGAMGLTLFFLMAALGYGGVAIQTAVFLYESLAQLAFVYPSRRLGLTPARNRVLNGIIVASVGLQILTVAFPPLRTMLALTTPDAVSLGLVSGALLITVLSAEVWTRRR